MKRRPKGGETAESLDAFEEAPVGTEEDMWNYFVRERKAKILHEGKVKAAAAKLNLMKQFLEARQAEDGELEAEVNLLLEEAMSHQNNIDQSGENLLIQLLLKQGQVEIEGKEFAIDYSNAVFLHRTVVEGPGHYLTFIP